ncbi:high-mobility group 20a [Trichoderma arundinaceum]|uniref:High-mobility group 20a n=1 Tax=Trichoderma arundinaceum TaxID=490622 RepID=A0A395NCE2_TRIAR|nr:high-mobility group 20a [Trichoderma arundinaceum]
MQPAQMDQELDAIFRELGIAQYLDTFVEQGFDTWDTILDIQESDLWVDLIWLHPQRLQRRIANARGIDPSVSLSSIKAALEDAKHDGAHKKRESASHAGDNSSGPKRKYRRHPKPDENAPERPMSAYVLFSNKIAKLVGENWQSLPLPEREVYEGQARASKERYYREMALYKETPEYRKYMRYLEEFNEKQAKPSQGHEDVKRARLEHNELTHGSSSAGSSIVGSIVGSSTALGGSTSTASGSSSERMRESESREPPNIRHNSANSILSASESHHSSVAPMPSPASAQFDVDMSKRNKSRHLRRGSSLRGITHMTHQADMPQQHLPSLSDMLASGQGNLSGPVTENTGLMHGFAPANHRPPASQGVHTLPPVSVPSLHHEPSSGGSTAPTVSSSSFSRRLSDGPLPIHALLSDQAQTLQRGDESPSFTSSYVASPVERGRPAFGQFQGPKGYGFQTASSAFQHMKVEETSDGDVLMTSADEQLSGSFTHEVGGLDGVNALLRAGEIFGHRQI